MLLRCLIQKPKSVRFPTGEEPIVGLVRAAERSVLGACLIRQEAIDEIRDLLDGDDFFFRDDAGEDRDRDGHAYE